MKIDADSTQHVHVPVTASDPTGANVDPTGATVEIGFLADGSSVDQTVWVTATWEPGTSGPVATVLVQGPSSTAPGDIQLAAPGLYSVRYRVSGQTESPAVSAGWLTVEA